MLAQVMIAVAGSPAAAQTDNGETLYARLGGYDFIARFVDTAFPRVASEDRLVRLFRGHSVDSQMRQRQLIVNALCHHTGGPCIYIGRDLTAVHRGLNITEDDWAAFMTVITSTLSEFDVPADTKRDLVALFETLKATVVER